jgi:hypothetical protein
MPGACLSLIPNCSKNTGVPGSKLKTDADREVMAVRKAFAELHAAACAMIPRIDVCLAARDADCNRGVRYSPVKVASAGTICPLWNEAKVQIGAEILVRISREFGKSVEWLLAGEG